MPILFGEYLPDQAPIGNPGLVKAKNSLPYGNHYRPFPGLADYSTNALSKEALGFISVRDKAGVTYSYAGEQSELYRLASSAFVNASRTADYTTAADGYWEFAKWGERVFGTNYADAVQEITLGASNFAALAGTPPRARHITVVREFVVLGDVLDFSTSAAVPNRVHWCGFDNPETWAPSAATQADYQTLQGEGGWVQRIIGGEYGTIFQERSIWRMTYIGSPEIFQFDEVESSKGTPCPASVVRFGSRIFYLGQDDFYIHENGYSRPIGAERVYKTFLDDYDQNYYYNVQSVADPVEPLILFKYPGSGNVGGIANKLLVYNWAVDKWSGPVELTLDLLCNFYGEGYTLDQLDTVSASLDALPYSLDSRQWTGGALSLAAFNNSHKLQVFTGANLTATFETGDRQIFQGQRALIINTRPLVEATSATISVAVSGRTLPTNTASFSSAVSINADGECPVINESRYHRFQVNAGGDFSHAQGLEVEAEPGGRY